MPSVLHIFILHVSIWASSGISQEILLGGGGGEARMAGRRRLGINGDEAISRMRV